MENDLAFRVVGFPNGSTDLPHFEDMVEKVLTSCSFTISTMEMCTATDISTLSTNIPKVLHTVLRFIEVTGCFMHSENSFKNLITLWKVHCLSVFPPPKPKPWLVVNDKRAFGSYRKNKMTLQDQTFHIGTLVSSDHFVIHESFTRKIHFYHDTRCMKIRGFVDLPPPKMKCFVLVYADIRHILVDENNILLVYSNPPIPQFDNGFGRRGSHPIDKDVLGLSTGILLRSVPENKKNELLSRLHFRCFRIPIVFLNLETTTNENPENPLLELNVVHPDLNFDCRYLIEALVRQKYILKYQDIAQFVTTALARFLEQPQVLEQALSDLIFVGELGYPLTYKVSLNTWFKHLRDTQMEDLLANFVPSHTKLIRRVVLTPTRVLLFPKEIMMENRILRNFDPECALRVSFRDDDYVKLTVKAPICEGVINDMIFRPMADGLVIAGRKYEFLAWSNSQLRDHSVWMYAKDERNNTSESIRMWMGNFSSIRNVAKYMARMGQCFSQSTDTVHIPMNSSQIRVENDIRRRRRVEVMRQTADPLESLLSSLESLIPSSEVSSGNDLGSSFPTYCFSDGIGKLSDETAKEVRQRLRLTKHPCAFQIRHGGAKGMVVLDPTLSDSRLVFRKSMIKFESDCDKLEIVKYSQPSKVRLNRPLICILEHLGVRPGVFLRMQEDHLETITEMLLDGEKAVSYLQYNNNLVGVSLRDVYNCGIHLPSEPFFRAMLQARHQHDLWNLKTKARLPIDPSEGRNMFGVLDETNTLEYGQVFVQYTTDVLDSESISGTTILTGRVMVSKNPCHLEGDVRMLQCVDVPALQHIVDCIVFPQKGHRPHPDELSGSDLDGDEYSVIWKEELLFPINGLPATFTAPREHLSLLPIQVLDMIRFLVTYIKNDVLGFLSSCHLAISDQLGVDHQNSIQLGYQCKLAVDFPKTGKNVFRNSIKKPKKFPDFMEKGLKKSYRSPKVLGKLFRVCRDFEAVSVSVGCYYNQASVDPDLQYPGWEEYRSVAERALSGYRHTLLQLMGTYGVKHESEAMTGCYSSLHSRFKGWKDRFEAEQIMATYIRSLWKQYKEEFFSEMEHNENFATEVLKKVSAYYVVTYSQVNPTVLSFPWIFTKQLAQIKLLKASERREQVPTPVNPVLTKLNFELENGTFERLDIPEYQLLCLRRLPVFEARGFETLRIVATVFLHWASEVELLYKPGARGPREGFMTEASILQLIMVVAEKEVKDDGPMPLLLNVFRFCNSLRFLSKQQKQEKLSFPCPQSGLLSKLTMTSYRDFAMTCQLSAFKVGVFSWESEMIEMEHERVQIQCAENQKERLKDLLMTWSHISDIYIRKDATTGQYVITAFGSPDCVRRLKKILRMDDEQLRKSVDSGILSKNVW